MMNSRMTLLHGWERRLWRGGLLLLACVLLGGCNRKIEADIPVLAEGRPFPPIQLNFESGEALSIQSFRGKVLILNVWATWCPPCRREMPGLEQLSRELDPKKFAVIGISTDEDAYLAQEFIGQNQITFANFLDQDGRIAKALGLQVYPETFVVAADGVLLERHAGYRDWNSPDMVARLEQAYLGGRGGAKARQ